MSSVDHRDTNSDDKKDVVDAEKGHDHVTGTRVTVSDEVQAAHDQGVKPAFIAKVRAVPSGVAVFFVIRGVKSNAS